MNILQSVFLGIVQGITEWLPISSSGHLAIVQNLMNLNVPIIYDIILHIASLLIIIIFFRKQLSLMIKQVFTGKFKQDYGKMFLLIIVASIPTAVIGFFLQDFFESSFLKLEFIAIALIITGLLLLFTRFIKTNNKKPSFFNSIIIGIFQGIAIMPGISRSGATISSSLLQGINKEKAIEFSFLLAIPAIIGALIYKLTDLTTLATTGIGFWEIVIGFVVSLIISYFSLFLLTKIIQKGKLWWFSIYCFALAIFLIIKVFIFG